MKITVDISGVWELDDAKVGELTSILQRTSHAMNNVWSIGADGNAVNPITLTINIEGLPPIIKYDYAADKRKEEEEREKEIEEKKQHEQKKKA
ncbi:MAG TPA: hypothetical protein VIJ93_13005 [bacterium]